MFPFWILSHAIIIYSTIHNTCFLFKKLFYIFHQLDFRAKKRTTAKKHLVKPKNKSIRRSQKKKKLKRKVFFLFLKKKTEK